MSRATLEQAASSPDSARLAEKAGHLGSVRIGNSESVILIPEGAAVMRLKGREARFFSAKPDSTNAQTNGYTPIPEGAKKVQFPEYEGNAFNVSYGNPEFHY